MIWIRFSWIKSDDCWRVYSPTRYGIQQFLEQVGKTAMCRQDSRVTERRLLRNRDTGLFQEVAHAHYIRVLGGQRQQTDLEEDIQWNRNMWPLFILIINWELPVQIKIVNKIIDIFYFILKADLFQASLSGCSQHYLNSQAYKPWWDVKGWYMLLKSKGNGRPNRCISEFWWCTSVIGRLSKGWGCFGERFANKYDCGRCLRSICLTVSNLLLVGSYIPF